MLVIWAHLGTLFAIVETCWVIGLSVWIVQERRSPVSTLAWIFGLALLPVVGIPLYVLFGPRRLLRRKLRYRDRRVAVTRALAKIPERRIPPELGQLMAIGVSTQHTPATTATRVQIYRSGDEVYRAILDAIGQSRHHVHVEYYIFEDDAVGAALRDALTERARAGVVVRVLVDAAGSPRAGASFFRPLLEAGGKFARFNPPRLGRLWASSFNFRTHRKIVVVDGRVGFTGGMNVAGCHSESASGSEAWRDTHLLVEGPIVHDLQRTFLENWAFAFGQAPTTNQYFPELPEGDHLAQLLRSGPDRDVFPIHAFLFSAIATARERVLLTTPYLVPDEPMLTALKSAAQRGVKVDILVPAKSDLPLVRAAARTYYQELLASGCRVYEYAPRMMHAKTLVVDQALACVGTSNMDNRSFRLNFEVMAVLYGTSFAGELEEHFREDLRDSVLVNKQLLSRESRFVRLTEAAARLISPLL